VARHTEFDEKACNIACTTLRDTARPTACASPTAVALGSPALRSEVASAVTHEVQLEPHEKKQSEDAPTADDTAHALISDEALPKALASATAVAFDRPALLIKEDVSKLMQTEQLDTQVAKQLELTSSVEEIAPMLPMDEAFPSI